METLGKLLWALKDETRWVINIKPSHPPLQKGRRVSGMLARSGWHAVCRSSAVSDMIRFLYARLWHWGTCGYLKAAADQSHSVQHTLKWQLTECEGTNEEVPAAALKAGTGLGHRAVSVEQKRMRLPEKNQCCSFSVLIREGLVTLTRRL